MASKVALFYFAAACIVGVASPLMGQSPRPAQRPRISQGALQDGEVAPDFTLQDIVGKTELKLAGLRDKPVVLVFGSCTCPPFVASLRSVEELHERYKDRVHFYLIYVREAHPTDGRAIASNQFQVKTPTSLDERREIAGKFAEKLKLALPVFVDTIDDKVERTYAGWPNRMYILGADGKIADKGMAGPGGVASSARRAGEILDALLKEANRP